jgi:hypothetical protein
MNKSIRLPLFFPANFGVRQLSPMFVLFSAQPPHSAVTFDSA